VDFSPASIRATQAALLLAADDAKVTLIHVVPDETLGLDRHVRMADQTRALFERLRAQLAPFTPARATLDSREMQGEVIQQLLEGVDSLGAELLAVGTEGPGFVERMFLGSTAASALHLARCTVLASPAPAPAEAIDIQLHLQGTATITEPQQWSTALDAVSRRDVGRLVRLEVDDRDIGAQVEATGYLLRGITFDHNDRRVTVMLEAPDGTGAHLTRSISNVDVIGITTKPNGADRALVFKHGRGQTLLLFTD
jgi:nucleotide-binding universal stress UspA family protein